MGKKDRWMAELINYCFFLKKTPKTHKSKITNTGYRFEGCIHTQTGSEQSHVMIQTAAIRKLSWSQLQSPEKSATILLARCREKLPQQDFRAE